MSTATLAAARTQERCAALSSSEKMMQTSYVAASWSKLRNGRRSRRGMLNPRPRTLTPGLRDGVERYRGHLDSAQFVWGPSDGAQRLPRHRRARATSARFRSAARRLFFDGDAVASEKAGQRVAAPWDSPLVKRRNTLIQREGRLRTDECEDLPGMLLQW
jgi:hypothetical protein